MKFSETLFVFRMLWMFRKGLLKWLTSLKNGSILFPGQRWPHLSRSQDDSGNSSNIHVKGSWDRKEKLESSWCNVICSHFLHQISENGMWAFLLSISRESFVGRGDGEIHKPERTFLIAGQVSLCRRVCLVLETVISFVCFWVCMLFFHFLRPDDATGVRLIGFWKGVGIVCLAVIQFDWRLQTDLSCVACLTLPL